MQKPKALEVCIRFLVLLRCPDFARERLVYCHRQGLDTDRGEMAQLEEPSSGRSFSNDDIYRNIDERLIYGELRLSRLNKIYRLSYGPFLRGNLTHWNRYGSAIVYITIVLTAMQIGLATKSLADNDAFQSASYGVHCLFNFRSSRDHRSYCPCLLLYICE